MIPMQHLIDMVCTEAIEMTDDPALDVCAAFVRLDKAVALGGIEPFHNASGHESRLSSVNIRAIPGGRAIKWS